ncbi:unnamed protein product, partial [Thlaspi arvense]
MIFRSITALKYYIQTGLDSLEDSRKILLDRLLEIDQTMESPREEDIERVRYCPNCQPNGEGLTCVHCELDELFQAYEARLFRLNKGQDGGLITSAEEAVDLQKKKSALNRFYWTLSRDKNSSSSSAKYEDNGGKRDAGEKVLGMRKEYAQARSLAIAQAQIALKENDDDKSIDALSLGELEAASVENSSEKFLALNSLSRIKGQLRYLK